MMQLFRNAWLEWRNYTSDGKLAALLLATLLYLWFGRKHREQKAFLLYTTAAAICCILPATAALLCMYQTKFYDYRWIWSLVPQTAVTAYGTVLLLADCWAEGKDAGWRRGLPVTALLLAVFLLCGGLGAEVWNWNEQAEESRQAQDVLAGIAELCQGGETCLWAPREIMEYAREIDAAVKLPYGRDMWDISLNAYTYDVYDENTIKMYQWMQETGENAAEKRQSEDASQGRPGLEDSVAYALSAGVNCILLPQDVEADTLRRIEELLDVDAQILGEYYLLIL